MLEPEAAISTRSRLFGMLAIVDTRAIKHHLAPGSTRSAPTLIEPEHMFVVGTGLRTKADELILHASTGDIVSLTGTSTDHNASDAVIVYNVQPVDRQSILGPFEPRMTTRSGTVEPDPDSASRDGLPALETTAHFSSFESAIQAPGTTRIRVDFARYALGRDGQKQILVGYYACGFTITVAPL